jgi:YhzD-like protein
MMKTYKLTVFEKDGKKILDDTFEASSDNEAKETGEAFLEEKGYLDHTHRCTSPLGKLILFHA